MLDRAFYAELRALARRQARLQADAEDLLQETLAAALVSGRAPDRSNVAWLRGTMRNLAAMQARSAMRRRHREDAAAQLADVFEQPATLETLKLPPLPRGLRIVALLSATGHNRAEIRSLLRLSDVALRQRIAELQRRWKTAGEKPLAEPLLRGALAFGSIRRGLLPMMRTGHAAFASHDPDGHPIAFGTRSNPPHKSGLGGNRTMQKTKGSLPCSHAHASAPSAST